MQYNSKPHWFTSPTLLPCNFRKGAQHLGNNDSQMSLTLFLLDKNAHLLTSMEKEVFSTTSMSSPNTYRAPEKN